MVEPLTDLDRLTRSERVARTDDLLSQVAGAGRSRAEVEDQVIRINMCLARQVSRRYEGRGISADDLRQVAYLGLVKAVRSYDPAKATDFHSFAVPTIRGELRRWFRDAGWVVRPPRSVQELQPRITAAQEELTQSLHRSPRPSELASHLEVEVDQVRDALCVAGCFAPTSLDGPENEDADARSPRERLGGPEHGYASVEARVALRPFVSALSRRELRILEMRFYQGATQAEIGAEIGVTQMQVSRLLSAIFARLRDQMTSDEACGLDSVA